MILNLNSNNNRASYFNGKRFFIILLFLNTFLGCIYIIHEQKEQEINQHTIGTSTWNNNFNHQHQYLIKTNKALEFIQNTLQNEYNYNDLIKFYDFVQKEYSLGLKCTRQQNISQPMAKSNLTNQIKNTTIR